jgi:HSP20 family protein
MLDDFFSDNWLQQNRSLARDTFKIDIEETETEYRIEAELPGIKKDDINLNIEEDNLCISVSRAEEVNNEGKNYIHRERRASSMSRRIRLANAQLDKIKAKLNEGILSVAIPKQDKAAAMRKIEIE